MNEVERRYTKQPIELRESDDEAPKILGYGAVFDSRSENLGGFTEIVSKGAFDDVMDNDVRALFNHDSNFVLGRSASGTLSLSVDETGLRYELAPPDTQTIRDLVLEPMRRGDITGSSFGFMVEEDDWNEDTDTGAVTRTIVKVSRLLDVSPVTYPAYPDTSVALRALNQIHDKPDTIRALLGLDETATDDEVNDAVIKLNAELSTRDDQIARLSTSLNIYKRIAA